MTFIEYVKFYKRNSLTNIELEVFGIPRLVTGWKALYAKLEVTDEMLDGSWPTAVEFLEAALENARGKKS